MIYRADWVHPITGPPVRGGWVEIAGDRVAALGTGPVAESVDLGAVVVLPALVNAHTHLELSYLAGRVTPAPSFLEWVRALLAARRERSDPSDPVILEAARAAVAASLRAGTGLVGEVTNTLVTVPLIAEAGLAGQVFFELVGFGAPSPGEGVAEARARVRRLRLPPADSPAPVRVGLAPHAPYSVSGALFAALRADLDAEGGRSTVHLAESLDELELLAEGTGAGAAYSRSWGRGPTPGRRPACRRWRISRSWDSWTAVSRRCTRPSARATIWSACVRWTSAWCRAHGATAT